MTLVFAWIRKTKGGDELVFASDSRLSAGANIDICQKIFPLPRGDCAIAFCGTTGLAYPFLLQLLSVIGNHRNFRDRIVDFSQLIRTVVFILNKFVLSHQGILEEDFKRDLRQTQFLLGGWSSTNQKYILRRISYDNGEKKYVASKTGIADRWQLPRNKPVPVAFVGDYIPDVLRDLGSLLRKKGCLQTQKLDYEPLEILVTMLDNPIYTDRKQENKGLIGGAVQMLKVYRYSHATSFRVKQGPENGYSLFFEGRPLFDFEEVRNPIFVVNQFSAQSAADT
jgi:hypothetical protein